MGTPAERGRWEKKFVKKGALGVQTGRAVGVHLQRGWILFRLPFLDGGNVGDFYYFLFCAYL